MPSYIPASGCTLHLVGVCVNRIGTVIASIWNGRKSVTWNGVDNYADREVAICRDGRRFMIVSPLHRTSNKTGDKYFVMTCADNCKQEGVAGEIPISDNLNLISEYNSIMAAASMHDQVALVRVGEIQAAGEAARESQRASNDQLAATIVGIASPIIQSVVAKDSERQAELAAAGRAEQARLSAEFATQQRALAVANYQAQQQLVIAQARQAQQQAQAAQTQALPYSPPLLPKTMFNRPRNRGRRAEINNNPLRLIRLLK